VSDRLRRDLEAVITGEVRFDAVARALYSTDASVYQVPPIGVVLPRTAEDVVRVVEAASRHGVAITARGGGTSQAGQAIGAGLVLDTSKHLNQILEVNADERWARVQPGVVLDALNARLRPLGLRFAPDISSASRATVGGMMANNSSGARSVVYGMTIDHVLEQHVVLSDGRIAHLRPVSCEAATAAGRGSSIEARAYEVIPRLAAEHAAEIERRFPKILRRVGGYNLDRFVDPAAPVDLTRIMVGSEGTLGLVVEARVALVPLPRAKALLVVEFEDALDALSATPIVLRHRPAAVEVMDGFILGHTREHAGLDALRRGLMTSETGTLLCIELYGDHEDELPPRLEAIERDLAASHLRCQWRREMDVAAQARVWSLREAALGLSMAMKGDEKTISFVEDTAVAPEKLREYISRFLQVVRRHGSSAGVYAHASVGCLHVRPVVNLKTAEGVARFEAIASDIADLVLEFGGALSGEHGDGLVRGPFNERMFGPELYGAFRTVKRTFDPQGIFNPGKIVDSPPITSSLRYGAGYVTPDPPSRFDFTAHGGHGRAVEMCSGVGVCRKSQDGTMCPSYMATRDEVHSTRGRANVLRLAMNGRLGDPALDDEAVRAALDLCLECRACKSECPVGVDMARLKSEFLSGYWERHGTPLKARAFGDARSAAVWGSRLAPLSNALAGSTLGKWAVEALLGVDRRRTLPQWTRRTLSRRAAAFRARTPEPRAVVFADTFTEHADPEIGLAALEVLDRAGIGARTIPHGCCGRPFISQGLLEEAAKRANANANALYDAAHRGQKIVFVEPSCLSAVREDAPALLRGLARERAQAVAGACVLFEDFLEAECRAGRASLPLSPGPKTVLLHPHCHQRSMGLAASAKALLSRIPGATVTDLDAGCCGMAGSFGYTRDHYDVSQAIGERRLLPAARAMAEGDVLVASGTSCRHQVAHFAGARSSHPAILLASLLKETR